MWVTAFGIDVVVDTCTVVIEVELVRNCPNGSIFLFYHVSFTLDSVRFTGL